MHTPCCLFQCELTAGVEAVSRQGGDVGHNIMSASDSVCTLASPGEDTVTVHMPY